MRKLLLLASSSYTILLTVLSLLPHVVPDGVPANSDKVFHAIAHIIFTILWYATLQSYFKFTSKKAIKIAVISAITFGIIIEVLQHTLTQYREADIKDVLANTLGAFIAVLIIKLVLKMKVKNN